MNFWVVKSKYDNESKEGWHWSSYLYEDCEGYDWGGEDWIRSKESQKYIKEGVRKGDIIVCSQRGEGILGFTILTGDGKDDPIGSGAYNTLPIASSTEAFVLDPILPIPTLKETGCNPKCFMPGRMGTVFPLDKEEFKGIINVIIKYYPEMGEDIINWLKRQGFEHQCEIPKVEGSVEFKIVKAEQTVASIPGKTPSIDDCILELFLLIQVGWSDGEYSPMEIKYFYKCIPSEIFDEVIKKWNEIEELCETMSDDEIMKYYEESCQKAISKDESWKVKVVKNMIQMAKSDRRVYPEELSKIAEIADKIGAGEECKRQLLEEFECNLSGGSDLKLEPKQRDTIKGAAQQDQKGFHPYAVYLSEMINQRRNGQTKIKLRKLLQGFGYQRRTESIISEVGGQLSACNLLAEISMTEPSSLDQRVIVRLLNQKPTPIVASRQDKGLLRVAAPDFQELAEQSLRATVEIHTEIKQGSGFIIGPDGLVVTGRHVVDDDGLSLRTVKVFLSDGKEIEGTVFRSHRQLDFALLWLKGKGPFSVLSIGNPQVLRPAQAVLAIGSPVALENTVILRNTVTQGIICNPKQLVRNIGNIEYIQTDTVIGHGNSGGPLIASDGVVGITLWGDDDVNSAKFAVPIDYLTEDIAEAIRYGKKMCLEAQYCPLCGHAEFEKTTWFCRNCGMDFSTIEAIEKRTHETES